MNNFLVKLPSLLAFFIGIMSILAGGRVVFLGWRPDYRVLMWLPIYNFIAGWLTLLPAYWLWINHRYALAASLAIFTLHAIVLVALVIAFRGQAAAQSFGAMSFRLGMWFIILALVWFRR